MDRLKFFLKYSVPKTNKNDISERIYFNMTECNKKFLEKGNTKRVTVAKNEKCQIEIQCIRARNKNRAFLRH